MTALDVLPAAPPPGARFYLHPTVFVQGTVAAELVAAGAAARLAGGPVAFTHMAIYMRTGDAIHRVLAPLAEAASWIAAMDEPSQSRLAAQMAAITAARPGILGLESPPPLIMGVINVTPDSFSDGGEALTPAAAIARGRALIAAGADMLDIGGESTRPGAEPTPPEEELRRVLPVLRGLTFEGVPLSIDTRRAAVMSAALDSGARIVNDITALGGDPESLALVARRGAPAVLMHSVGEPRTMQRDPRYIHAALDVYDSLEERLAAARAAGIDPRRLALDPGIGFAKTLDHNLQILRHLSLFHGLGCPLVLGVSRKSWIARLTGVDSPRERLPGSLAAALDALGQGVQVLRVHDVAETRQAVRIWRALRASGTE